MGGSSSLIDGGRILSAENKCTRNSLFCMCVSYLWEVDLTFGWYPKRRWLDANIQKWLKRGCKIQSIHQTNSHTLKKVLLSHVVIVVCFVVSSVHRIDFGFDGICARPSRGEREWLLRVQEWEREGIKQIPSHISRGSDLVLQTKQTTVSMRSRKRTPDREMKPMSSAPGAPGRVSRWRKRKKVFLRHKQDFTIVVDVNSRCCCSRLT